MRPFFLLSFLILAIQGLAQIPPGYYDGTAGLYGTPLQASLHTIIDDHNQVNYSTLYTHFFVTDKKPDQTVWDMYSDNPAGSPPYVYYYNNGDECGGYTGEGDCYNREHSWPKSWFGGEIAPMYSDLFHLYPTDGWVNNKRGNYPFGQVGSVSWTSLNGTKLGSCSWPGYGGTVFEPINAYKGDFARTYFYMSVRYYGEDASWPGSDMTQGAQLKPWALAMMLQWHAQDPVSSKEIERNDAVYQIQGNRNPFIDNPQFAQDIWGPGAGFSDGQNGPRVFVHPNPVKAIAYIDLPEALVAVEAEVFLFSTGGRQVLEMKKAAGRPLSLNVSGLGSGMYFLRVFSQETAVPLQGKVLVP